MDHLRQVAFELDFLEVGGGGHPRRGHCEGDGWLLITGSLI